MYLVQVQRQIGTTLTHHYKTIRYQGQAVLSFRFRLNQLCLIDNNPCRPEELRNTTNNDSSAPRVSINAGLSEATLNLELC